MAYLVDTDILVDLLRRNKGAADYLDSIGDWSLSIVTGMELVAGAKNKDEVHEIDIVLATYHAVLDNWQMCANRMDDPVPDLSRNLLLPPKK